MYVARLWVCRELYELSGWDDTTFSWYCDEAHDDDPVMNLSEPLKVLGGVGYYDHKYPAYDLGYVLRHLPPTLRDGYYLEMGLNTGTERVPLKVWMFYYVNVDSEDLARGSGDTPEDAAARLAIALFEAGVLTA